MWGLERAYVGYGLVCFGQEDSSRTQLLPAIAEVQDSPTLPTLQISEAFSWNPDFDASRCFV